MYSKEVNVRSPLRILEESIHGGLGPGNLGVVMARAGVGKTAFLVQVGLDDLMRGKDTLHVALGQNLERVQSWYDALFDDLANLTHLEDREETRVAIAKHRVIQAYADHALTPERLEKAAELYAKHLNLAPAVILIDGFNWDGPVAGTAAALGAFKSYAKRLGAELWMSAQSHRSATGEHPTALTPPCAAYGELIEVAVFLEPVENHVTVRLLKDHGEAIAPATHLVLHPDTLRLMSESEPTSPRLPAGAFTLLSGGAQGAEQAFGELAERWGLNEQTFSFAGRTAARTRGLIELSDPELRQGQVSGAYLNAQLHRSFPTTPLFQKMLQSIWHQVNTASEVFVVGTVLPDHTVKGGTGWAAELARHWNKPLFVFDQEKRAWLTWERRRWIELSEPRITKTRFTGTGTRMLSPDGKAAIESLFERSFGR